MCVLITKCTHPDGLVYVIDVIYSNRGLINFVKQPSDISCN